MSKIHIELIKPRQAGKTVYMTRQYIKFYKGIQPKWYKNPLGWWRMGRIIKRIEKRLEDI